MKKKNITAILTAAVLAAALAPGTAFAGTWENADGRWRYRQEDGTLSSQGWIQDSEKYYALDENGWMRTGWFFDGGLWYYLDVNAGGPQGSMKTGWLFENGKWYFLDTRVGGPLGSMKTGWQWIDGKCYFFDPAAGGAMAASCTTADGYLLGADGAWEDAAGVPHYEVGRGISTQAQTVWETTDGQSHTSSGGGSGSNSSGSRNTQTETVKTDDAWENYSDTSVSYAANDFKNGNYAQMDEGEREELEAAIEEFQDTYLDSDMSDFEKEIEIIRWLVENCTYEKGDGWENATAYSCIINGRAQCSGYADAFLQTAKACGLDVRYVYNDYHAWNLIKLDGDWYHVDVTWEDPVGDNDYGSSKLRNKYINLEDSEIRTATFHHTWSPSSIKAKGVAYGPKVVAEYLKSGEIDTDKGESFEDKVAGILEDAVNEDGSNDISFTNVDDTAEAIVSYISEEIEERSENFKFLVRYPKKYSPSKTGSYSDLADINNEIEDAVNKAVNKEYGDILKNELRISLSLEKGVDTYYAIENGFLRYQEGQGKMLDYTIHYFDIDGNEVGEMSGTAEKGSKVMLEFPEGYSWISSEKANYQVNEGSAFYHGKSFTIQGNKPVDMDVRIRERKTSANRQEKLKEEETKAPEETKKAEETFAADTGKDETETEAKKEAGAEKNVE